MERKSTPHKPSKKGGAREQRLKAALKANMGRRKTQARARAVTEANQSQDKQEE